MRISGEIIFFCIPFAWGFMMPVTCWHRETDLRQSAKVILGFEWEAYDRVKQKGSKKQERMKKMSTSPHQNPVPTRRVTVISITLTGPFSGIQRSTHTHVMEVEERLVYSTQKLLKWSDQRRSTFCAWQPGLPRIPDGDCSIRTVNGLRICVRQTTIASVGLIFWP